MPKQVHGVTLAGRRVYINVNRKFLAAYPTICPPASYLPYFTWTLMNGILIVQDSSLASLCRWGQHDCPQGSIANGLPGDCIFANLMLERQGSSYQFFNLEFVKK